MPPSDVSNASRKRQAKLCPATLRSVARELRQSQKYALQSERESARVRSYAAAESFCAEAALLDRWATHFEGQAKLAEEA